MGNVKALVIEREIIIAFDLEDILQNCLPGDAVISVCPPTQLIGYTDLNANLVVCDLDIETEVVDRWVTKARAVALALAFTTYRDVKTPVDGKWPVVEKPFDRSHVVAAVVCALEIAGISH